MARAPRSSHAALTAEKAIPTKNVHQEGDVLERAAFRGLGERRVYTLSLLSSAMVATHNWRMGERKVYTLSL